MATTLGIDLGTTNSAVASRGRVLELPGGGRRALLPSVVAFLPTGATLVGAQARQRRPIDPRNTIYSSKRLIGRRWFDREVREVQERYPFQIVRAAEGPAYDTRAGTKTPVDVAAIVLAILRRAADRDAISGTVVGVPAGFGEGPRQATLEAARRAGFSEVRLVEEPVAVANAYLAGGHLAGARAAVVYDLGGGTFNFAVLRCDGAGGSPRVAAHGGDLFLGGDDVDRALATWAAEEILRALRWDLRADAESFDRLVLQCERAKIRLSFAERTHVDLTQVDPAAPAAADGVTLDRAVLAGICHELVGRTFLVCDQVLGEAGVRARDVDAVFLAGGSSQLPAVRTAVETYFGHPPRCDLDPMEVVAIGASLS